MSCGKQLITKFLSLFFVSVSSILFVTRFYCFSFISLYFRIVSKTTRVKQNHSRFKCFLYRKVFFIDMENWREVVGYEGREMVFLGSILEMHKYHLCIMLEQLEWTRAPSSF